MILALHIITLAFFSDTLYGSFGTLFGLLEYSCGVLISIQHINYIYKKTVVSPTCPWLTFFWKCCCVGVLVFVLHRPKPYRPRMDRLSSLAKRYQYLFLEFAKFIYVVRFLLQYLITKTFHAQESIIFDICVFTAIKWTNHHLKIDVCFLTAWLKLLCRYNLMG